MAPRDGYIQSQRSPSHCGTLIGANPNVTLVPSTRNKDRGKAIARLRTASHITRVHPLNTRARNVRAALNTRRRRPTRRSSVRSMPAKPCYRPAGLATIRIAHPCRVTPQVTLRRQCLPRSYWAGKICLFVSFGLLTTHTIASGVRRQFVSSPGNLPRALLRNAGARYTRYVTYMYSVTQSCATRARSDAAHGVSIRIVS